MSSIWQTLDIPRGSDRDAIRRGYARKLKLVHPEDDPEGFQALREAYEQALQHAQWGYYDEDEDQDEDALEHENAFEDASAFEDAASGFARTWHTNAAPNRDPGADAPQDEEAREHADLDARVRAFAQCLDPDAETDPDALIAAFDRILASPLMGSISARTGVEAWLAAAIAESIPRSDPVIPHAITTFGWDAGDHLRLNDWHIARIVRRIDEWNFIATAEIAGTDAHVGWRALTGPPLPNWRMRLLAWSATRRAQVSQILDRARYDMPGLRHHFTPERADWWEAFEARAHHSWGTLLLAPLVLWLVGYVAFNSFSNDLTIGYAVLLGIPLALAAPTLWLRLVKKRQLGWMRGEIDPPPRWFAIGWMPAAAALPLVAMLLPGSSLGIGIAFVLSALLVLWTTIALPPAPSTGTLGSRIGVLALRLWAPFIFWGTQSILEGPHRVIQTAVGASILVVWLRGRDELLYMLNSVLPRLPVPATYWAIPALIGFALLVHAGLPGQPLFFLAAMTVMLGWPLVLLLAGTEPQVKSFVNVTMWIALFSFYLMTIPRLPDTPQAAVTCPDGQSPDQDGNCAVAAPAPGAAPSAPPMAATETPASPVAPLPDSLADRVAAARKLLVPPPEPVVSKPGRARCRKDTRTVPGPPEPCGTVANWIVSSDYPAAAQLQNQSGTTKVDMAVDATGAITGCTVARSSGTVTLDEATCTLMMSRGRYLPARGPDGPVASRVLMTFTWQLED